MKKILYHNIYSPPSRMAFLTAKNLTPDLEIYELDILNGEQNSEEFLKLNPMHQVPTLIYDDFVVTESSAIVIYLASISDSQFYPKNDLKKKTLIDSRLFMDACNTGRVVWSFCYPIIRAGVKKLPEYVRSSIIDTLKNLEKILEGSKWFAGDEATIADFAFLANVATIKALGADMSDYKNLNDWYERCKIFKGFEENEKGSIMLAELLAGLLDEPLWK